MILARALLFNIAFYLWTALVGILGLPLLLAPRRIIMRFGSLWSRGCLRILAWTVGLEHEVRGAETLPPGPVIIAMKHQSTWDTLALPVVFSDPAIVIKRELAWIPIYGWYALRAGAIPIDRGGGAGALKRMMTRARAAAEAARPIAIFPEGTRTAVGTRRPYQPGVAALYTQLALPLVPVAVNSGLFWGRRAFLKRPGRITIEILPAIAPGAPRRAVMAELEQRIEQATARLVAEAEGHTPSPSLRAAG
ncbi:MAG TPA: lysophospholipid acyltransferase family protein [Stellaceae bacterium]|nr:lysophospholipid acyltransferase family protein [Stellaceae bacterium]